MKVETHNTPSALDPYGGDDGNSWSKPRFAGVPDGGQACFNTDVFCFAPPDYRGELPPMLMHPKRIFEGVRRAWSTAGTKAGFRQLMAR